ncbi:alpha-glucan family phosphorylase [Candidatus Methylacidiphilum fumarolicum]|nr:alpha-glucan family phosphorylase [Candidatus Methylacidiphilum fumarolicum]MBW6414496.1 alpha-glucan family phosphorylase [Candidatus Methylacidiphilum fumarolicum]TFE67293.1 alpha-glucan phosphorylase [Candidatus Methylacidiphilum fumarolicum]TFE72404.1 alpha-glucan family phosphorylase [Candidatus Methylacidiphilum fumarolicum]TFE75841.1 alpha-glucan family phosphorylase [Candidatus Methylacidiphilum fumarolicum]TFE77773.1 alpha-glucan phosphorylase [Candidatus Methylacidiphilum fumaroli
MNHLKNSFYRTIAYFSMEIAVDERIPTYSGGLGVLAGDTLSAAASVGFSMVGVSLLYRKGYFFQKIDEQGVQREEPVEWAVDDFLVEQQPRVTIQLENRVVTVRCWLYEIEQNEHKVPVYFLDTDLPENDPYDRSLSGFLYGGDDRYRLCQEAVLGIGGVRMLRALGYKKIDRFHMNEGHSSLLTLELLREISETKHEPISWEDIEAVRALCVFTTHTPVASGHDKFPLSLVKEVLPFFPFYYGELRDIFCCGDFLNMTYLALNLSHYINGVAKRHSEVSRMLFSHYEIDAITNGVHVPSWVSQPIQELFDKHIPHWREDIFSIRYAIAIPLKQIWEAHLINKRHLLDFVNRQKNIGMEIDNFTIGFARRMTAYKRPELIFSNLDRLKSIAKAIGPLQLVFAGKAHPKDEEGKKIIQRIHAIHSSLSPEVKLVFLENYDLALAKRIVAGVDLWLNNPLPPLEASGTSGMKAAINGVPSLSVLDGWWIEGCIEGMTGWSIGMDHFQKKEGIEDDHSNDRDANALYDKLEKVVMPLFYKNKDAYSLIMRSCIAINGSFFNAQRMLMQYVIKAYY